MKTTKNCTSKTTTACLMSMFQITGTDVSSGQTLLHSIGCIYPLKVGELNQVETSLMPTLTM